MAKKDVDNWEQYREWDLKYYVHPFATAEMAEKKYKCITKVDEYYFYTADGKKMLDTNGTGYRNINQGLRNAKISAAIKEAVDEFGFIAEPAFGSKYRAKASKLLIEDILGPDDWAGGVRWVNAGTDGNEHAIAIARMYTGRQNIISREGAYHGWAMGASKETRHRTLCGGMVNMDEETVKVPHEPGGFYVVPGHYCYRCSLGHKYPECKNTFSDGTLPCVQVTENLIRAIGYQNVAAIVTEMVYGVGCATPAPEYFPQLRKMTKKLGILWIDDEVITGAGRMGSWFAYQIPEYGGGVKPDMMIVGKGIINSQLPCGGIVMSKEIAAWVRQHVWASASTFKAHPVVMAALTANLEIMLEDNVVEKGYKMGMYLGSRLLELKDKHKCIGQITGRGGFWILDIDKNREKREPFIKEDRNAECWTMKDWIAPNTITEKAAEKGVYIATFTPNAIPICPTLTWSNDHVDKMVDALDYALGFVDKLCD